MIRLRGIGRDYQLGDESVHALAGIDLDIEQGEYVSIMGPSGSGKSTLLNLIGLLDRPTAGEYLLDDHNVTALVDDELARIRCEHIGFVFQFFHLISRLSSVENIEMPMILAGVPPARRKAAVAAALQSFGLEQRADHRPDQLSGGERQRVAIARATIMQPSILLADEPTGNLDQTTGHMVIDLLENLNAGGVTLIMVTHDATIGKRARRRIRLVDGRIFGDDREASA